MQPDSGAWSLSRTFGPSFRPLARSIAFWALTALPPVTVLILLAVDRHLVEGPVQTAGMAALVLGALAVQAIGAFVLWRRVRDERAEACLIQAAEALSRCEALIPQPPLEPPSAERIIQALHRAALAISQSNHERDLQTEIARIRAAEEQRSWEERFQAMTDALNASQKASQAKSDFLANMSHELRTPLNAVIGFAQLLETKLGGRQEGEYAGYIHQAGEQLHLLLNDILDLAKIESGQLNIEIETTPLGPLFEQLHAVMAPMAEARGVRLDLPPSVLPASVSADPARLRQVMQNLISNAIKYNRPGGSVTIDVTRQPLGRLRIYVSDTGTGIPTDRRDELFKAFSRLGHERGDIEGTGIGLAICRHLVMLMGGTIDYASAPGVGSQFWVELAAADAPQTSEMEPEATDPIKGPRGRRRRILYIEDNAANLTLMTEALRSTANFEILTAENGVQGLELAAASQPDVILLDIRLPDIDGFQVLSALKRNPRTNNVPVIAVSAHARRSDVDRGLEAGFLRYLTKPFLISDLMDAITLALRQDKSTS